MSSYFVESQVPQSRPKAHSPWTLLRRVIRRQLERIRHQRRIRRDINSLMEFDDRMLADIGLNRGEVVHAVVHGRLPQHRSARIRQRAPHRSRPNKGVPWNGCWP